MILGLEKFALYFPERRLEATPQSVGLDYEEVWFAAADGVKLHGWLVPAPGARFTVVWFHGNAGNISHRVSNIGYLHRLLRTNVFIFDYRGYGQSQGGRFSLSEEATYRDAEGAMAYLRSRRDLAGTSFVYFGRSLGAAVAVELTRHDPPAGLILETTFSTLKDVARVHYPFVPLFFLQIKYETVRKLPEIRDPDPHPARRSGRGGSPGASRAALRRRQRAQDAPRHPRRPPQRHLCGWGGQILRRLGEVPAIAGSVAR